MAMMASGTSGDFYDDDNAVLDDDFLNDGSTVCVHARLARLTLSRC